MSCLNGYTSQGQFSTGLIEMTTPLNIYPLTGIPLIEQGDNLPFEIEQALQRCSIDIQDGDVLVVAQKIVSKAEGRQVLLADIEASDAAIKLARETDQDERLVELILRQSQSLSQLALP